MKKRLQNNTTKIGYDKLYDLLDGYYICVLIVSSEFGNGCQNLYTDKENKVLAACIIVIPKILNQGSGSNKFP